MDHSLQPFEMDCDAPTYAVVKVCRELGLVMPEDVRWLGARAVLAARGKPSAKFIFYHWNDCLLGTNDVVVCSCGGPLPFLKCYQFTLADGREIVYGFGQCHRCLTIYWAKE